MTYDAILYNPTG